MIITRKKFEEANDERINELRMSRAFNDIVRRLTKSLLEKRTTASNVDGVYPRNY